MKKSLIVLILSLWAGSGVYAQQGGYVDDLYQGSTKKSKQREAAVRSTAEISSRSQKQSQQMPANWSPRRQTTTAAPAPVTSSALVTSYDEALQRRLDAYKSYREMDDDYWKLMENFHKMLSNKYDPDLYNVITFGNEMWVEPVYITALFDGSDPAAGVRGREFAAPQQNRSNVTVNVNLGYGFGPGWWWDDPWDYYWYSRWRNPWRWGPYWGWNSYWGWYGGWGPGYYPPYWGPSWGWGPSWWPGYYPPYGGGGHGGHYGRPVIWGDNRPGWGPTPGYKPGYRPGGGSSGGRPGYSGGFRRNENGTGVSINNGGGNRRPGGTGGTGVSIRPGGAGNQYNPGATTRPTVSGDNNRPNYTPSTDRSYRREVNPQPAPRRETQSQPTRSEPSYSAPSRGSGVGSFGGGGGSSSGGGGYRRR